MMVKRLFLFFVLLVGALTLISQDRWYVNINDFSNGAGTFRTTAWSDLRLVINNASAGDTIWVAQGTYAINFNEEIIVY